VSTLRRSLLTVAVLALVVASTVVDGRVAVASGERAGDVVVVDERGAVATEGGSATAFGLHLPAGAACPGDSADDDYRVEAFLVPEGTDVGSVVYGELAPQVEGGSSLWDTNTNVFDGELTSDAPPGDPGLIVNLPNFSFGVLYPDELAAGAYRIGIACSLFNDTERYWDTSFVVTADASDQPAGFRWTADPPADADRILASSTGSSDSSASSGIGTSGVLIVLLVLLLLVAGVAYLWLRVRTPRPSAPKERSS
jgi:hypothetical protein